MSAEVVVLRSSTARALSPLGRRWDLLKKIDGTSSYATYVLNLWGRVGSASQGPMFILSNLWDWACVLACQVVLALWRHFSHATSMLFTSSSIPKAIKSSIERRSSPEVRMNVGLLR